jgi:hypothetical protein
MTIDRNRTAARERNNKAESPARALIVGVSKANRSLDGGEACVSETTWRC